MSKKADKAAKDADVSEKDAAQPEPQETQAPEAAAAQAEAAPPQAEQSAPEPQAEPEQTPPPAEDEQSPPVNAELAADIAAGEAPAPVQDDQPLQPGVDPVLVKHQELVIRGQNAEIEQLKQDLAELRDFAKARSEAVLEAEAKQPTNVYVCLKAFDTMVDGAYLKFKRGQAIKEQSLIAHLLKGRDPCPIVPSHRANEYVSCPDCGSLFQAAQGAIPGV